MTPLHYAAEYGHLGQVPKNVLSGVNLMVWAEDGMTPLHFAVKGGHLDQLLGLELPELSRRLVGEEWWSRNQAVILDKRRLDIPETDMCVELF